MANYEEVTTYDLVIRTISLVAFFVLVYIDNVIAISKIVTNEYIKYSLLGYALVGNKLVEAIILYLKGKLK